MQSRFQTCLSEQEEPTQGIDADIELFSTKELAYYMTLFDWDLFWYVLIKYIIANN